jgi:hypothetical protein
VLNLNERGGNRMKTYTKCIIYHCVKEIAFHHLSLIFQ